MAIHPEHPIYNQYSEYSSLPSDVSICPSPPLISVQNALQTVPILSCSEIPREGAQFVLVKDKLYKVQFDDLYTATSVRRVEGVNTNTNGLLQDVVGEQKCFVCGENYFVNEESFLVGINSPIILREYDVHLTETEYKTGQDTFDGICFSGGGAKGVLYIGILQALGAAELKAVKSVSGTSVGSLFSAALATGANAEQITDWALTSKIKLNTADVETNALKLVCLGLAPHLCEVKSILHQAGYPLKNAKTGKVLSLKSHAREDLNHLTFKQLQILIEVSNLDPSSELRSLGLKDLTIVATANGHHEIEFSAENSPNVPITKAMLASCTFPLALRMKPVIIPRTEFSNARGVPGKLLSFTDGGITNNLPHIYAKGKRVLTLSFAEQNENKYLPPNLVEKGVQLYLGCPNTAYEKFEVFEALSDPDKLVYFIENRGRLDTFDFSIESERPYQFKWIAAKEFKTERVRALEAEGSRKQRFFSKQEPLRRFDNVTKLLKGTQDSSNPVKLRRAPFTRASILSPKNDDTLQQESLKDRYSDIREHVENKGANGNKPAVTMHIRAKKRSVIGS
ncbi:hypothetical protein SOPP22_10680 [Shewanella sp. OPT22]|nr:hypothetical protein SOPP22_10680 [Shewanella sp. OPT22]